MVTNLGVQLHLIEKVTVGEIWQEAILSDLHDPPLLLLLLRRKAAVWNLSFAWLPHKGSKTAPDMSSL